MRRLISKEFINEHAMTMDSTMDYVYETYGYAPSSSLNRLSSYINANNLRYLGRFMDNNGPWDVYANESTYATIPVDDYHIESGTFEWYKIKESAVVSKFGITPAIEDITEIVDKILTGYDYDVVTEDLDFSNASVAGAPGGGDAGGGGEVEDITQTTQSEMGDMGGDMNDAAGNMEGDDFGNPEGDGEDDGTNPEMMDDDSNDDDSDDDEGTKAKKRIRINMYKLHTVIKDALDAMSMFTPAYNAANSKKYYRIQSVLNTEDEILLKIITERINEMTVEDLMKKYTTLCQIFDIATRELHEFKEEYTELAEKASKRSHNTARSSRNELGVAKQ